MTERNGSRPGDEDFLVVGEVVRPHGSRGVVVVRPETDNPRRFSPGNTLLLDSPHSPPKRVEIASSSKHKGMLLVGLEGFSDRISADSLRGRQLLIRREEAMKLGEDEYWVHQLMGMNVVSDRGKNLGKVVGIGGSAVQETLVIEKHDSTEFEVPAVKEFVLEVDARAGLITVRVIKGMV